MDKANAQEQLRPSTPTAEPRIYRDIPMFSGRARATGFEDELPLAQDADLRATIEVTADILGAPSATRTH